SPRMKTRARITHWSEVNWTMGILPFPWLFPAKAPERRKAFPPRAGWSGAVDEGVVDRAGGRTEDDDEQGRQDEQDQRHRHDRRKPRGLLLGAHHPLVPELGRQEPERRGGRGAVFLRLGHGGGDPGRRLQVGSPGEVLGRLAPLVEEPQ